jgi:hypothetical protein
VAGFCKPGNEFCDINLCDFINSLAKYQFRKISAPLAHTSSCPLRKCVYLATNVTRKCRNGGNSFDSIKVLFHKSVDLFQVALQFLFNKYLVSINKCSS